MSASSSSDSSSRPPTSPGLPSQGEIKDRMLVEVSRPLMACNFEVLLNSGQYPLGPEKAVEALDLVERMEQILTVYRPDSELSRVNREGGARPVKVSNAVVELLEIASLVHRLTSGAFDISAATLSETWGFSRRKGRKPSDQEISEALARTDGNAIIVDRESATVQFRNTGVKLNPGGIGKGLAIERASRLLLDAGIGDFLLHGGQSSVSAHGARAHHKTGGGWLVGLRHPFRPELLLGQVRLRNQALATSGAANQFFHYDGKRYGHIIDPRTGWPADGPLSTTVIHSNAAFADAFATGLYVMGTEAALEFCGKHPEVGVLIVKDGKRVGETVVLTANLSPEVWLPV